MCRYWKKLHTCDHESDRPYVEWCRDGIISRAICPDITEDPKRRKSHFPCYQCIKLGPREQIGEKSTADQTVKAKAEEDRSIALKAKQVADRKAHEEKVRRDATQKAAREREEELRMKKEKEDSDRKAKTDGGAWIESGGKKGKHKKNVVGSPGKSFNGSMGEKKNATGKGNSPNKDRGVDGGGRAGVWGPKKILTRKENENVAVGGSLMHLPPMKR